MEVTNVNVRQIEINRVKAICSITFDDEFVIHGVRLIDGENGLFVAMPSRKLPSGIYRDIAHPINTEMRTKIQDAVIAAYNSFANELSLKS